MRLEERASYLPCAAGISTRLERGLYHPEAKRLVRFACERRWSANEELAASEALSLRATQRVIQGVTHSLAHERSRRFRRENYVGCFVHDSPQILPLLRLRQSGILKANPSGLRGLRELVIRLPPVGFTPPPPATGEQPGASSVSAGSGLVPSETLACTARLRSGKLRALRS